MPHESCPLIQLASANVSGDHAFVIPLSYSGPAELSPITPLHDLRIIANRRGQDTHKRWTLCLGRLDKTWMAINTLENVIRRGTDGSGRRSSRTQSCIWQGQPNLFW